MSDVLKDKKFHPCPTEMKAGHEAESNGTSMSVVRPILNDL